jgi:hypothetical protein
MISVGLPVKRPDQGRYANPYRRYRRMVLDRSRPPVVGSTAMIEAHPGRGRFLGTGARAALSAAALAAAAFTAGCGTSSDNHTGAVGASPSATASATASKAPATPPTAACPLVDKELLPTLYTAKAPKLTEKDPVKSAGNATTYSCDVSDEAGQLFLTVGVAVAPPSGTAAANVKAALEGASGEPVSGVGEAGAFAAKDGVGTVAGVTTIGGKQVLLFAFGADSDKSELIKVAQSSFGRL